MILCKTIMDGERVVLTVRLIRSFEHRNIRHIVMKGVDTAQTVSQFKRKVLELVQNKPDVIPPFRTYQYDTMKIHHQAHRAKGADPVINVDDDDNSILKEDKTLNESGVCNETELSFFKLEDYIRYKENPQHLW
ncbi:UPF0538 protein C2orf76 homolog [Centruroides sculpturatus]|uniref:UPF0538 protein C2orf76 homolog n=1 Tax=Centruroides sculpturatus TaxID=218467 RepID=UPI000C6CBE00|nr:UPF0538 protein C2orf76 homolog [Centruroides sculpturatus]